ncbi:pyruvate kinase [Mangrovibacterium diazotrophicum]|uniref:Pyruvate kinase n=1 Tax=Mangrovibacterium diazotrophicum TaxID=1261403 RepID=A0A419VVE6_9BACT|nr:pyruvate kinase [Mangrovibacterium diazotrophicum]RKD86127.1 pyruvate kinase [Mangrovibacterium diazotrophicum]
MTIEELIDQLLKIRESILACETEYKPLIDSVHPNYHYSARNFVRYLRLRTFELRPIQEELSALGLSSIGHSERYVLANIENILYFLHLYVGQSFQGRFGLGEHPVNYFKSLHVLDENTDRLLGKSNQPFHTRIMVTLPTSAAEDKQLIRDLMDAGMENARINCSHDSQTEWARMAANVREIAVETKRDCKVYMDLPGPKLRTEQIVRLGENAGSKDFVRLEAGDYLRVDVAERNDMVFGSEKASVVISIASVVADVKVGERIWFDDGKIGGMIEAVLPDSFLVKIVKAKVGGTKLKAEKGINLPDTKLNLPSLPDEDLENLPFILKHADLLGYSFVRTAADVEFLQQKLKEHGREDIGVVLKIENEEAFSNVPELILTAMRSPNIGLMIARGDLAVELGPERISEVQEMLLWLCEAAFIPNIWATQVFEHLAKEGIATRAEITDASMSARSECVMLNKGDHIVETVRILSSILGRMEAHQYKKKGTLRPLNVASRFLDQRNRGVDMIK